MMPMTIAIIAPTDIPPSDDEPVFAVVALFSVEGVASFVEPVSTSLYSVDSV
jgi:hypothetical protein